MIRNAPRFLMTIVVLPTLGGWPAEADAWDSIDIGIRGNVLLGDGVPANDILGAGVMIRMHVAGGWFLTFSVDRYDYDFERPHELVGIMQDSSVEDIDSTVSSTVAGGGIGREYRRDDQARLSWFWSAGIAVALPDAKDVTGPAADGGTFDLAIDAGTEIHLLAAAGSTWRFNSAWSLSAAARAQHHFMDATVTDRQGGATANVDSQSPLGVFLSLNYSF